MDTGFQNLNEDIVAIIGQNESGKSSILEALEAFGSNKMMESDIRGIDVSPMVTCKFSIDGEIKNWFRGTFLGPPSDLDTQIRELKGNICIKKKWNPRSLSENPIATMEGSKFLGGNVRPVPSFGSEPEASHPEHTNALLTATADNFINEILRHVFIIPYEDKSMLPSRIDLADIENKNTEAEGYTGTCNFLLLADLTAEHIRYLCQKEVSRKNKLNIVNNSVSEKLQQFWSQMLGEESKISIEFDVGHHDTSHHATGQPYLSFLIKDKDGYFNPKQRSLGVRWFLSFFLAIMATAKREASIYKSAVNFKPIILIDEMGSSLHGNAQKDALALLENIKENLQIVYATHSPFLVNVENLHRILVAERKIGKSGNIETKILPPHKFGGSHRDAILPLYSSMGMDLSHQEVIKKNNNVILEEISAFYYLKAFLMLFNIEKEIHFLPATGCNNIRMLANLLLGWGIEFSVLVDDESSGCKTLETLEKNHILLNERLIKIDGCEGIEDIFVKEDFSEFVLHGESIPEDVKTSKYLKKKFSKPTLAADFKVRVEKGEVTNENLTKETRDNINKLITKIIKSLETHSAS